MSIWDFFVSFFWFYIAISCVWIFITVIIDVFRDDTLSGSITAEEFGVLKANALRVPAVGAKVA